MLDKRVTSATEKASILTDAVDVRVDGVQAEVNLLKIVVGQDEDCAPMSKVKFPYPKPFGGARSVQELENFYGGVFPGGSHSRGKEGIVRDYVKKFNSLMLDLWDMSEEDKLLNFLSGLQAWAQTELRRQGVKDLSSVNAAISATMTTACEIVLSEGS
ncbi:hypothetical protein Sango_2914700 [Sesamum angolense]|uniref:Uncharacterized protein n=1 Tax=Sesamum angolense TaxID=2727404 RepID=A0AAE1T698_9LAMI|nr:hypothetical protein Sango_2914700 [Sesamum angolense]